MRNSGTTEYQVEPLYLCKGVYQIPSRSKPSDVYSLLLDSLNGVTCECLGFVHRGKCWHSDMMVSMVVESPKCPLCHNPILIHLDNDNTFDQHDAKVISGIPPTSHDNKEQLMHVMCVDSFSLEVNDTTRGVTI